MGGGDDEKTSYTTGGSNSSSTGTGTTEQNTNQTQYNQSGQYSWTGLQDYVLPYAMAGLENSYNLGNADYSAYPYYADASGNIKSANDFTSTVSPMNETQTSSLNNILNEANRWKPTTYYAQTSLADTLSGKYLDPESNTYLQSYVDQALSDVTDSYNTSVAPQLSAAASRAGAFGGSTDALLKAQAMKNLGSTLSKTATDIYYPAYESERSNMMTGLDKVSDVNQLQINDYLTALGVGDAYQTQAQAELSDKVSQWEQASSWPYYTSAQAASQFPVYGWGSQSSGNSWSSILGQLLGLTTTDQSTSTSGSTSGTGTTSSDSGSSTLDTIGTGVSYGAAAAIASLFK